MAQEYRHLGNKMLRDWAHVEIEEDGDSKTVILYSRWHVGNRFPLHWSYSKDYSIDEILRDPKLATACLDHFGPDVFVGSIHI